MNPMTRPTPGRLTFHRLTIPLLRETLLEAEARSPSHSEWDACSCPDAIATYLRPIAYLAQPIGSAAA